MSERSMGSEFDRKRVDGNGEQRRQQNAQSNQAGGQQGTSGASMGHDSEQMQGPDAGPRDQGLADQVNQGLAQADPEKSTGSRGSSNAPGDANGSGSMGSTRRDDAPRAPRR